MILIEIFQEALSSLWQNKGRTFLSVLGIVIGIASVITMMAIGRGTQESIASEISSLGTGGISLFNRSTQKLTQDDIDVIMANDYSGIFDQVLLETNSSQTLVAGSESETASVTGVSANYLEVENKKMALGSFFSDEDFALGQRVIAIGPTTATNLFASASEAIGQRIKVGTIYFTVTGVFAESSGGGMSFSDPDDFAIIPLSTMQNELLGSREIASVTFTLTDETKVAQAKSIIGYTMLARHNIENVDDADFGMFAATDLLETLSSVTGMMTALLAGIAGISLLVGGIGIMNVMLMSVLERTREIGLRKALGAQQRYLITQFLFEAILVTFSGGAIGFLLGWGASSLITHFSQITAAVTWDVVLMAIGISTAIGLIFGIYPARKAAKLAPIEALRSE
ncbi:ABC transporter permease [bacterium]|nr:ABC transporter permease [bacterium]